MSNTLGRLAVHNSRYLVALLLIVGIPFGVRGAGNDEIRNYIISIGRLHDSLEYELALNRIQLARQVPRGTEEEVTLALYEGIILCEMGKLKPGSAVFKSALFLRPDAKLPVQVAPKIEQLFESVRKQVKREVATLLSPREEQSPAGKTESVRELPPTPPAAGSDEDKTPALSSKEEPSRMDPRGAVSMAVESTSGTPDCEPRPSSVSKRNQKEFQSWRLVRMKYELCSTGAFQGRIVESWSDLKTRMDAATTSLERTRISQDIDEFEREFIYGNPRQKQVRQESEKWEAQQREAQQGEAQQGEAQQREAQQREAQQREAQQREAQQREAQQREAQQREAQRARNQLSSGDGNLHTSGCQPVISSDCELLLKRLLHLQEAFLKTVSPSTSRLSAIRDLVILGREIRAARTDEELEDAANALKSWQQRHLPQ